MTQPDEKSDAEKAFGEAVRNTRLTRQWTQEELRRRLLDRFGIDLSKTAMARLELGQRPIRLNEVHALATVLGISLAGFGRPSSGHAEVAGRAASLARERRAAVLEEMARIGNELEYIKSRVDELMPRYISLRAQDDELDKHMKNLAASKDPDQAQAILMQLLRRDSDGDR